VRGSAIPGAHDGTTATGERRTRLGGTGAHGGGNDEDDEQHNGGEQRFGDGLVPVHEVASRPRSFAVTYEELLNLAREVEGRTLETVTGKRFRVGVYLDCPYFIPESSGLGQTDGRKAAERFVARYNEIGSLRPGDYAGVTRNASYYIGLLLADLRDRQAHEARR
jgi:hypothetical protein